MYDAQKTADIIKKRLIDKGITGKLMCQRCNLGVNTLSNIRRGDVKSIETFQIIAEYLDCSVDYLLGRTDVVEVNRGVKIIVDDGRNVTPYMAAYDGSSPDDAKMSLKTIKQLDDEN